MLNWFKEQVTVTYLNQQIHLPQVQKNSLHSDNPFSLPYTQAHTTEFHKLLFQQL